MDYGGGSGSWVWSVPNATVYDPSEDALAQGRAVAEANGLALTFTADRDSIESADAIICIRLQQYLSDAEIHDFLAYSASRLTPGGRLLLTIASPGMVFEWLARLYFLRHYGWRRQAKWTRTMVHGAVAGVGHSSRTLYCRRVRPFVKAAKEHGLHHETTLPHRIDREFRRAMGATHVGIHYRWVVFRR